MAKSTPSYTSKNLVSRFLQLILLEITIYMTLRKLTLKLYKIWYPVRFRSNESSVRSNCDLIQSDDYLMKDMYQCLFSNKHNK